MGGGEGVAAADVSEARFVRLAPLVSPVAPADLSLDVPLEPLPPQAAGSATVSAANTIALATTTQGVGRAVRP